MSNKILTISGREVDPFTMAADDMDIQDIAHSLSMQCRFAGHIPTFYSVAEHCVRAVQIYAEDLDIEVEELRGDKRARSILMHDADEAYLQDLVNPVKIRPEMADYLAAGDRLHVLTARKFDVFHPGDEEYSVVKTFDRYAYQWERENIRTGLMAGTPPHGAKAAFMGMWYLLRPSNYG